MEDLYNFLNEGSVRFQYIMAIRLPEKLLHPVVPVGGLSGSLNIQWHVTARCDVGCRHCYMYDSPTYDSEIKNELSFEGSIKVLDQYRNYLDKRNLKGNLSITGGDPLLREDLFDLLKEAKKRGFENFNMMGNPDTVTQEITEKLFSHGVRFFQFSLDGDREYHDMARKEGSFDLILPALKILQKAGMRTNLMFTLGKENKDKLFSAMTIAAQWGSNGFAFAREVAIGKASEINEPIMSPEDFKELLLDYLRYGEELNSWGFETRFADKDHLFVPLRHGDPGECDDHVGGLRCYMGYTCLGLLADGSFIICRRLPIVLGHLPGDDLTDLIENHPLMKKVRDPNNFTKCKDCAYSMVCLGAPCVAYGLTGDPFASDPQCWM